MEVTACELHEVNHHIFSGQLGVELLEVSRLLPQPGLALHGAGSPASSICGGHDRLVAQTSLPSSPSTWHSCTQPGCEPRIRRPSCAECPQAVCARGSSCPSSWWRPYYGHELWPQPRGHETQVWTLSPVNREGAPGLNSNFHPKNLTKSGFQQSSLPAGSRDTLSSPPDHSPFATGSEVLMTQKAEG